MGLTFAQPGLLNSLEAADAVTLDSLSFGVIGMTTDGAVTSYNAAESRLSGLTPANVIGVSAHPPFFAHLLEAVFRSPDRRQEIT